MAFSLALELGGAALSGAVALHARRLHMRLPPSFPPGMPAWLVSMAALSLAGYAVLRLLALRRARVPRVDSAAVKEGFDNLPCGVCLANARGAIFLCNRRMHALGRNLIGGDLQHIDELRAALASPPPSVIAVNAGARAYRFPDGRAWKFDETALTRENGEVCAQIRATDITRILEERLALEHEKRALDDMVARARALRGEVDRLSREEETLAMKLRVHDQIGAAILISGRCLSRSCPPEEARECARMWRRVARTLGAGGDAPEADFESAVQSAARVGVALRLEGEGPQSAGARALVVCALKECATNCARHAGGARVRAVFQTDARGFRARITNDGAPPQGEIREGGGLSTLRRMVEARSGEMRVISRPAFELRIFLPDEEA